MDDVFARSEKRHRAFVAVVIAAVAVAITYAASSIATRAPLERAIGGGIAMIEFTIVGALILDRRPGQPVGRICLAIGLLWTAGAALEVGALVLAQTAPLLRTREAMGALAPLIGNSGLILAGPVLISRFPNGSTPGWGRRVQDLVIVISWAAILISDVGFVGFVVASLLAGAGIVLRYRRGGRVERAQIRWFGAAVGTTLALSVALILTIGNDELSFVFNLWILSFLLPPIAIGIAILRYRLYEIDRIISNTIGYAIVSVALLGVFGAAYLVLAAISPLGELGDIGIAASTLLAAVLFNPVRLRVKRVVDRRFHRATYDAERTVAGLAGRLRDEVDIARLRQEILDVVDRSLEPTDVHLWLRPRPVR